MKLSEQLKQDHECGDFGKALEGYSERAKVLECTIERLAEELENARYEAMEDAARADM